MIKKLQIKNFKCLKDTGKLKISPLTLLVGPNSSGKSSLIYALLILKQTVDSRDVLNPLLINSNYIKLGTYKDLIYGHKIRKNLCVFIEFEHHQRSLTEELFPIGEKMTINTKFMYNEYSKEIELQETSMSTIPPFHEFSIIRHRRNIYEIKSVDYKNGRPDEKSQKSSKVRPFKFYGYRSITPQTKKIIKDFFGFAVFPNLIENLFTRLFYIGPLRAWPERFYIAGGEAPQDVGLRGERSVDVLVSSGRSGVKKHKKLLENVNKWIRKFNMGLEVKLKQIGKVDYYQLIILDPYMKIEVNLPDVGFGVSQLLPVIVEGYYAPSGAILLIEQPEIHLHPMAQCCLGDLLIEIAKQKKTVIVETHSEHIISRVRRRIAEGKINRNDVSIYYFEPGPEGSIVQELKINNLGQFENWPLGFFEEDFEEAVKHFKIISKKQEE